jgi:alpha,alpha-trehalase
METETATHKIQAEDRERFFMNMPSEERMRAILRSQSLSLSFHNMQKMRAIRNRQRERFPMLELSPPTLRRRSSIDVFSEPRTFLIDVEDTMKKVLAQEDTDGDMKITVNDRGPKVFTLGTLKSEGYQKIEVRGTYMLSNLLQELSLAKDYGLRHIAINESNLNENPVMRISRMIRDYFWTGLMRCIDENGIKVIQNDPKNRTPDQQPRVYVPITDPEAYVYFKDVSERNPGMKLDVVQLPKMITPKYVAELATKPGILTLDLVKEMDEQGQVKIRGVPFVVPGGRFNEMYGWDSYFEALGLLVDGKVELAKSMLDNLVYEINHYGMILNANRSYYLLRSQPPFLTDFALRIFEKLPVDELEENMKWLQKTIRAAIHEYRQVWMSEPRYTPETGLSRYYSVGVGMPTETEATHFDSILAPYAAKLELDIQTYGEKYNKGEIIEPELDDYFIHDRAIRESGHDTTYRFESRCAHLNTVDLNALLYKYEMDIAIIIQTIFDDHFILQDGTVETSEAWFAAAKLRKARINTYLWNEDEGMYFDYDIKAKYQIDYESATTFFTLWSGVASVTQANAMIQKSLPKLEVAGGLVSGTERSRGIICLSRPNRQWDYPYGWAPHQILAWQGLANYGYIDIARRLAYRWLFIVVQSVVDFNGTVPEKYDVVARTHRVFAEYGNVGTEFQFMSREGFGWMNASFQVGLSYLTNYQIRGLGALIPPESFFRKESLELKRLANVTSSFDTSQ